MKKSSGPFQVINVSPESTFPISETPKRDFTCSHYEQCLGISAALNWDGFSCRGCATHSPDEHLMWQARNAQKKDAVAKKICEIPEISVLQPPESTMRKKAIAV